MEDLVEFWLVGHFLDTSEILYQGDGSILEL